MLCGYHLHVSGLYIISLLQFFKLRANFLNFRRLLNIFFLSLSGVSVFHSISSYKLIFLFFDTPLQVACSRKQHRRSDDRCLSRYDDLLQYISLASR